jgi:GpV Apex motif
MVQPFREAGLPDPMDDSDGEHTRYSGEIGVVRKTYPDLWRVDIEPQEGGLIRKAQVYGHTLPEVHIDVERPSYVEYWCRGGNLQDIWCSPLHWRRLKGPESATEPEKRLYHKHLKIQRVGDITIRVTPDNRIYLYDAETGDIAMYEQGTRTLHIIGPHVFVGTDAKNRAELHTETTDDRLRVVIPKAFIGKTAVASTDGISYTADQLLHLVSTLVVKATAGQEIDLIAPLIKLTADQIVLDPTNIKLGHANATERLLLGDLFKAFLNAFLVAYTGHTHAGVQTGAGTSGVPTVAATLMDDSMLSDVAHVSKAGV